MATKAVSYTKEMRAKAKAEGLHLITLDITGEYAKRDGVTYQTFLLTPEEVNEAWSYFERLARRTAAEPKPKRKR